jgi:hypothetical protein
MEELISQPFSVSGLSSFYTGVPQDAIFSLNDLNHNFKSVANQDSYRLRSRRQRENSWKY